jgi:D-sedoheptulose 7-phosphate isomerase
MKDIILKSFQDSIDIKAAFIKNHLDLILRGAKLLSECIRSGHKILIFGNGGSAADAQHIAAEFVNRFQIERPPLPAIALTTDSSVLTSIANDDHFNRIFSKQIEALGCAHDIAWGISTSGNSENVIQAMHAARQKGLDTIGLTGGKGGALARDADLVFLIPSDSTPRIQETHILLSHILCDLVERTLYPSQNSDGPFSDIT